MKSFALALSVLAFSTVAKAENLLDRLQEAQSLVNRLSLNPDGFDGQANEAQKRSRELSNETFEVSKLLIDATANPTEAARSKVCQQSSRALDVMWGIEQLAGYNDFRDEYNLFREVLTSIKRALACDISCSGFVGKSFRSEYLAYNGTRYQATLSLQQREGSFQSSAGFTGKLQNLECKDGGLTLTGQWSSGNSTGWFSYYLLSPMNGEFKGSWGDFRNGQKFYQGQWNGEYNF